MRVFHLALVVLATAMVFLTAKTALAAPANAQESFDKLKLLSGSWEGRNSQGEPLSVAYRVTAGGSAHMYRAFFTIVSADHHTEEWDFIQNGKEMKQMFDLQRSR